MTVQIGSKFTGKPQGFACTTTGTYWEVLPKIHGDDLKLQRGLLAQPLAPKSTSLPTLSRRYAKLLLSNNN